MLLHIDSKFKNGTKPTKQGRTNTYILTIICKYCDSADARNTRVCRRCDKGYSINSENSTYYNLSGSLCEHWRSI